MSGNLFIPPTPMPPAPQPRRQRNVRALSPRPPVTKQPQHAVEDPASFSFEAVYPEYFIQPTTSVARPNSAAPTLHNGEYNQPLGHSFVYDHINPNALHSPFSPHDDTCLDSAGCHYSAFQPPGSMPNLMSGASMRNLSTDFGVPFSGAFTGAFFQPGNSFSTQANYGYDLQSVYPEALPPASGSSNMFAMSPGGVDHSEISLLPGYQAPEDTYSNAYSHETCSSNKCCTSSHACQDDYCSEQGEPCDDARCLEDAFPDDRPSPAEPVPTLVHHLPCNHTHTEHDAALTLQELRVPGPPSFPPQVPASFDHQISFAGEQFIDENGQLEPIHSPYPISPFSRPISDAPPSPSVTDYVTDITLENSLTGGEEEHTCQEEYTCQWIESPDSLEEDKKTCGQTFHNIEEFQEHICHVHVGSQSCKTKFKCLWDGCSRPGDQFFASRNKLRRHISTHTAYKPHKCHFCGSGFSAQQALEQHIRTHTGETPFRCSYPKCGKAFKQKSALTMHERTHTGEKPLKCEHCGKTFGESSNLSKHKKIHEKAFKYVCNYPECKSSFIRPDQLRRHQKQHENRRARRKAQILAREFTSFDEFVSPGEATSPSGK
ncbi:hypothetical protein F5Y16DRAFT_404688 [Xylariaceae sp. FL0255]|nr:hypothetical protein F5Y16DRAFT_404688 [Xylariaceae sp. FL0255]